MKMIRRYNTIRNGIQDIDSRKAELIKQVQISFPARPDMEDGCHYYFGVKLKLVKVELDCPWVFVGNFEVPKEWDAIDLLNMLADCGHRFNSPKNVTPLFEEASGT
jgi:hypothetical protein